VVRWDVCFIPWSHGFCLACVGGSVVSHCPLNRFFKSIISSYPTAQVWIGKQETVQYINSVCVKVCVRGRERVCVCSSRARLKWLCALKSSWRGNEPEAEPDQSGLSWSKTQSSPGNECSIPTESMALWVLHLGTIDYFMHTFIVSPHAKSYFAVIHIQPLKWITC